MGITDSPITDLLRDANDGNKGALDRVMEIVYADLQRIAEHHMRDRFGPGLAAITLEPTALVNETYLRLIKQRTRYDNRGHFFAIATRLMLRVLMDYHRKRAAGKRGAGAARISLSGLTAIPEAPELTAIPDFVRALDVLTKLDARTAEIAKLRLIWGLTEPEIARALDLSQATVGREWRFARRWLAGVLRLSDPADGKGR